jgi:predicted aspartyl protease
MKYVCLALLLLAGCAEGGGGSAASCALVKKTELPIVFEQRLPVVAVTINGVAGHMVLDTGAGLTVFSEQARAKFQLPDDSTMQTTLVGIGNAAGHRNSFVETLQLGDVTQHNLSKVAVDLRFVDGVTADGYLGSDILQGYDVDLDLGHRRVTLYAGRNCPQVRPDWTAQADLLPASSLRRALQASYVGAEIDGHAVNAVIDTGATSSVVDRSFAAGLGVTDEMLKGDRHGTAQGMGTRVSTVVLHRFTSAKIGSETIARPNLIVTDLPTLNTVHNFQMLVGEDYLRTHRVWISYPAYQVYVAPAIRP